MRNKNLFNLSAYPKKGFTLIELLVVVAIIGILAIIMTVFLGSARDKARISKAKQDLNQIYKTIEIARIYQGKRLGLITGRYYTAGPCYVQTGVPNETYCLQSLTSIQNAASSSSLAGLIYDPWGTPYLLNENEGEAGDCSRRDSIRSYGPNKVSGGDDITLILTPSGYCP